MSLKFDFISASDKPALAALSTPEFLMEGQRALSEMEFKVHIAENHDDFRIRIAEVQYQIVILEELFVCSSPSENQSLLGVQTMPMSQRRHGVFFLIGQDFQTLNPFQAFQQSVHAVINPAELPRLTEIMQKVVAENDLFLSIFRDAQLRVARGKV